MVISLTFFKRYAIVFMFGFLSILLINRKRTPLVKKSGESNIEAIHIVVMILFLLVAIGWIVLDGYHLATGQVAKNHIPFLAPSAIIVIDALAAWVEFR